MEIAARERKHLVYCERAYGQDVDALAAGDFFNVR